VFKKTRVKEIKNCVERVLINQRKSTVKLSTPGFRLLTFPSSCFIFTFHRGLYTGITISQQEFGEKKNCRIRKKRDYIKTAASKFSW
jgi:hypothetical protein